MKTKILILTTGGTIASVQSPDGLVPGMSSGQLREHLPQIDPAIDIDIRELFHLDSSDMTLEAAVAKLMWILADEGQSWEEISDRFYEPIALDRLIV